MAKIYHRGEDIFLYVAFKDNKNQPMTTINYASVNISCENNGSLYPLLEAQQLTKMSSNEFYFNFKIPENAPYATYFVEYFGEQALTTVVSKSTEEFHIIPNSETYNSTVKVYGLVHQEMTSYPLIGVNIEVEVADGSKIISSAYTREDGLWEAHLYPGEYNFKFSKFGFTTQKITVQLGSNYTEIQFDNVTLESKADVKKGRGIYRVHDKYNTREGAPLNGLNVIASNVMYFNDINFPPVEDVTNNDGEWELFLDPGIYLVKVNGISVLGTFDQTFRVKVTDDGEFNFENITENVATPDTSVDIGRGTGNKIVTDIVTDSKGNPIIDVQVNVYNKTNPVLMIAQDYTNPGGKWEFYLNTGTYIFEFYHPKFHEFKEERTV